MQWSSNWDGNGGGRLCSMAFEAATCQPGFVPHRLQAGSGALPFNSGGAASAGMPTGCTLWSATMYACLPDTCGC